MEFVVKFESKEGYAVNSKAIRTEIGIYDVLELRGELGLKLSLDLFNPYFSDKRQDISIILQEKDIIESGVFQRVNKITVIVPENHFNQFLVKSSKIDRDERTGAIKKVTFGWDIDTDAIVNYWRKSGYPLEIED